MPLESFDWNIGLIVGPSGSGKSSLASLAWPDNLVTKFIWPRNESLLEGFPSDMGIKDITGLLSSVGFSSPPCWLKPFKVLSTGEQFRATIARALAELPDLAVVDEFTSVVDRQVAKVASASVAKAVRRRGSKFIAVTCHNDIADWLQPDWVVEMPSGKFTRRSLRRRPAIRLLITRVNRSAWDLFKQYHYLSAEHHKSASCFCAWVEDRSSVAFCSAIHFPHPVSPGWKEHRLVVLPDWQGVGIGNALSDYVASLFRATGKPYRGKTSNPGMVHYRARSPLWKVTRGPHVANQSGAKKADNQHLRNALARTRLACAFEYVGPARTEEAKQFGITLQ
jgi:energy-coupling factor transporter ATP-binding protein EcfA2